MKFKRLKLQHNYHDAVIRAIEFRGTEDITFEVDLSGKAGNSTQSQVYLTFTGVRNFAEVKGVLEGRLIERTRRAEIAEIVGIARDEKRGYLVDLGTLSLRVDAKGILET